MNRSDAAAVLDVWRELLADPRDRCKYGNAVQQLFVAAQYFEAEARWREAVGRGARMELVKAIVHDGETVRQDEHVEADPAGAVARPWFRS